MQGVTEKLDDDEFFPININFQSGQLLSGIKLTGIVATEGGAAKPHTVDTSLGVEKYVVG